MHVGWIGLGSIGTGMAINILKAGHQLTAYARGAGLAAIEAAGALVGQDYASLAAHCDVLGVCLFNDAQLETTLLDSGALAAMRPGSVVVVHTTGSPELARRLSETAPAGVETLDACFSGGAREVADVELTLMIGGTETGIDRARPILQCYASNLFHVGPAGAGQTAKLLNNLLFATNLRYSAEIIRLATAQGLDPSLTAEVVQRSSGASMAMGMFSSGRSPETVLENVRRYIEKDVAAAGEAAEAVGLDLAQFSSVAAFYR